MYLSEPSAFVTITITLSAHDLRFIKAIRKKIANAKRKFTLSRRPGVRDNLGGPWTGEPKQRGETSVLSTIRPHSPFIFDEGVQRAMRLDPNKIAVDYYFGDLQHWKLRRIAADALEEGYDGPALRKLAGLANPVESDFRPDEVDSAFASWVLTLQSQRTRPGWPLLSNLHIEAAYASSNVFDEATHIRIRLCGFSDVPMALMRVVELSNEAGNAPRSQWSRIEADLRSAFADLLMRQQTQTPE